MEQASAKPATIYEMALAIPALMWLAAGGAILIATLFGYRACAAPSDLTLSEAAALRDMAEVLRQIRDGVDPDAAATVRPGILGEGSSIVTPLEAATAARRPEVVQLLVQNGATITESNVTVLVCLAQAHGADDIEAFVTEYAPLGFAPQCDAVRLPIR